MDSVSISAALTENAVKKYKNKKIYYMIEKFNQL